MSVVGPNPALPWHAGEIALQEQAGAAERMAVGGPRVVRDHLIEQHRAFYPLLPFVVLGAVDRSGDAWATLRAGPPGFLHAQDQFHLAVDLPRDGHDPTDAGLEDGDAIGLLGIELPTRRRNRLNGTLRRTGDGGFVVAVEQSYGNCPQYIQQRPARFVRDPATASPILPERLKSLDGRVRAIIEGADTFFVATYVDREDGRREVDVSHRGGRRGFVRVGADGLLTIPDFSGNQFFNTLGNILANPRAGLAFVDFSSGDLLQLTGSAEVVLDSPEIGAFEGAERLWRFRPEAVVFRADALPLRFTLADDGWSPNLLETGSWEQAAARLRAATSPESWRPYRVARVAEEAEGIRSLNLEPADGGAMPPHLPGQHLPIRVTPAGAPGPLIRTYTISAAPSDRSYRLSVKREGAASAHLHRLEAGDLVEAKTPAGSFVLDAGSSRPAVLVAAGIGITPMLAMLRHVVRHVVREGARTRRLRRTWLFYAARTKAERAFDSEIEGLVAAAGGAVRLVRVLSRPDGAEPGRDYDHAGRIDMALLRAELPFDDYDFYLCGPPAFMQDLYDGLRGLNVADGRIHAESFGPASMARRRDAPAVEPRAAATGPVPVRFSRSGIDAVWTPEGGTLLDFAEARGLQPDFNCREGRCGACRTFVEQGEVAYRTRPTAEVEAGEALLCCAVPARSSGAVTEPLILAL